MDAYSWIEYLNGSPRGARVRDILEDPHNTIITSPVTMAEVVSKFLRNKRDPKSAVTAIENNSTLPPIDSTLARLAGEYHSEERRKQSDFGLADAFVLATARNKSSKILTGDPHFKALSEAVLI